MKINAGLILKGIVGVAGIAITVAEKVMADKEMKKQVAKEVAKALANK